MQGNPPQDILVSTEFTSDDPDHRLNRSAQTEKEQKFTRSLYLSPRKVGDGAMLSPAINRRHGFMELSTAKTSPKSGSTRTAKETPMQQPSAQAAGKRDETFDVAQLNALLQSSISKLSSMENEKNDRYERWKQEVLFFCKIQHEFDPSYNVDPFLFQAVEHGMKMVEMERKRSDEEHAVLLKRIAFLTEELEETKRQLRQKVRKYPLLSCKALVLIQPFHVPTNRPAKTFQALRSRALP